MRLSNVESVRMLPQWMRDDAVDLALSRCVDRVVQSAAGDLTLLPIWNRIDDLPEAVLDELAWALSIEWWDPYAPIEVKRAIVRQSDLVHAKKGTPAAVESVVAAYFDEGRIEEWFEYGGQPHHYRILTPNATLVHENLGKFMKLLGKVARKSSKLDTVTVGLEQRGSLCSGTAQRSDCRIDVAMGRRSMVRLRGTATSEIESISIDMTERTES